MQTYHSRRFSRHSIYIAFFFSSEWLVVSWVVSKAVVKLNVIDFISCFCCETFWDDGVLFIWNAHLEVVKDWSETGEVNKTCPSTVLVLVVWLHEQSSVFHISSKSHQTANENLLFLIIEDILRIKDWWCCEVGQSLCWFLLEIDICENHIIYLTEVHIVD